MLGENSLKRRCRLVIESVSEDGRRFRPSDWIERISTQAATFANHKIHYSKSVQPRMVNGNKCLVVEQSLQDENPKVYEHIMSFVKANNLIVREVCDTDQIDGE